MHAYTHIHSFYKQLSQSAQRGICLSVLVYSCIKLSTLSIKKITALGLHDIRSAPQKPSTWLLCRVNEIFIWNFFPLKSACFPYIKEKREVERWYCKCSIHNHENKCLQLYIKKNVMHSNITGTVKNFFSYKWVCVS